jgi:hypothetical protein
VKSIRILSLIWISILLASCGSPPSYTEMKRVKVSGQYMVVADKGSHATAGYTFTVHLVEEGEAISPENEIAIGRGLADTMELKKLDESSVHLVVGASTYWMHDTSSIIVDGIKLRLKTRPENDTDSWETSSGK